MKNENFNAAGYKIRVLIAPLDWGLGHATRCIPIISKLLTLNVEVFIAAAGETRILLKKEFPQLPFIELRGYRVKYSPRDSRLLLKLLLQFPRLLTLVYQERRWLKNAVRENKIDAVISDNRPGLSHPKIPCVYITHQLTIKTGNRFSEKLAQKIHYHFINTFNACWVPDSETAVNLAGELSHPARLPKTPVTYLGPLSRFMNIKTEKVYDLGILLSGPEPQRTIFEKIITRELRSFPGKAFLVRGLPANTISMDADLPETEIRNHLPAGELNTLLEAADLIICRSGYTGIMDLVKLRKKAILVPTPGQTEQEYLAGYLEASGLFGFLPQKTFSLNTALDKAQTSDWADMNMEHTGFEKVLEQFVERIRATGQ